MAVYPPIAPSTFRWFRLPTGHAPATLPCDAVEPPTTRQIGDSPTFDRIVIGGVQEAPHNNQWLVGWRPIRFWSEFIWARRIRPNVRRHTGDHPATHLPVTDQSVLPRTSVLCVLLPSVHCPPLLGWAPMKSRWKCPTSVPPVSCYYRITYRLLRSHSC